jgi:hypothetical protein
MRLRVTYLVVGISVLQLPKSSYSIATLTFFCRKYQNSGSPTSLLASAASPRPRPRPRLQLHLKLGHRENP